MTPYRVPTPFERFQNLVRRLSDSPEQSTRRNTIKNRLLHINESDYHTMTIACYPDTKSPWIRLLGEALTSAVAEKERTPLVSDSALNSTVREDDAKSLFS